MVVPIDVALKFCDSTVIRMELSVMESDFKKRLRERRIEMGYDTQGKLAKALGMTTQTISYYENGERKPDYETFAKIARVLNCSLNYLYGIDDLPDEEWEQIHKKQGSLMAQLSIYYI